LSSVSKNSGAVVEPPLSSYDSVSSGSPIIFPFHRFNFSQSGGHRAAVAGSYIVARSGTLQASYTLLLSYVPGGVAGLVVFSKKDPSHCNPERVARFFTHL
jgi:hypothetical protein